MDAVFIKPDELRACWSFIRAGLLTIQNKSPEPWIPEDVYADCYSGRSILWLLAIGNEPVGFGVLQPKGEALHVWCAFLAAPVHFDEAWQHLQTIAKQGKSKRLTFESWRPGWVRRAKQLGFKPRSWAMEVL